MQPLVVFNPSCSHRNQSAQIIGGTGSNMKENVVVSHIIINLSYSRKQLSISHMESWVKIVNKSVVGQGDRKQKAISLMCYIHK